MPGNHLSSVHPEAWLAGLVLFHYRTDSLDIAADGSVWVGDTNPNCYSFHHINSTGHQDIIVVGIRLSCLRAQCSGSLHDRHPDCFSAASGWAVSSSSASLVSRPCSPRPTFEV